MSEVKELSLIFSSRNSGGARRLGEMSFDEEERPNCFTISNGSIVLDDAESRLTCEAALDKSSNQMTLSIVEISGKHVFQRLLIAAQVSGPMQFGFVSSDGTFIQGDLVAKR